MIRKYLIGFIFIVIICFSNNAFANSEKNITSTKVEFKGEYFQGIVDMIGNKYAGDYNQEKMNNGIMKGMFGKLDPFSEFYTKKEAEDYFGNVSGNYSGIGVMVEKIDNLIIAVKIFQDSPAEKVGILPGDAIISIEGKNAIGIPIDEAVSKIRGEKDTKVKVGIRREGVEGTFEVEIIRGNIEVNPVTYRDKDGVFYLKLEAFNANAAENVKKALKVADELKKDKIVLDLRENPGGNLDQVVEISKLFIPEGLITKLDIKDPNVEDQVFYSDLKEQKYKLVILVNKNSASASEFLSGAVQDREAGKLVGTKTFGKAKVQDTYPILSQEASEKYSKIVGKTLINAEELFEKYKIVPKEEDICGWGKLTIGFYYTPSGKKIDEVGLTPDYVIDDPEKIEGININNISILRKSSKPNLNDISSDVFNAEKILKILGYINKNPDSKLDDETFYAISKFQGDNGLFPYGVLDFSTQNVFNKKLDDIIRKNDMQYSKALEILNEN